MVHGLEITVHAESEVERLRVRSIETKEPETLAWIERFFKPNDIFYDIGANIGIFSLFAAVFLQGACQVVAFEPESQNYAKLNLNIFINKLSEKIKALAIALTDHPCIDSLYINPAGYAHEDDHKNLVPGTALHSFHNTQDFEGKAFQPIHSHYAVGLPLDDLWMKYKMPFPCHIKIDVDGIEEKVLSGMGETIRDPRLRSVLVEASSIKERELFFEFFKDHRFVIDHELTERSYSKHIGKRYEGIHNVFFVRD